MTRNCAVKKSLCGTERFSRLKGESDADDDCGFSVAEADADLAGVSSVDCSERWTALTARGGDDDASEELVITPRKWRTLNCDCFWNDRSRTFNIINP